MSAGAMAGAVSVSEVAVCNMAYGGRLDELRAQLQRDRGLATAADQVSAGRGLSPRPLRRRRLPLGAAG